MADTAHVFHCAGTPLVGVLSHPPAAAETALLVIVGGPQYRIGSHRQFVQLARSVAAAGHAVLRFDVRGMGDSGGAMRPFEALGDDIGAAIDFLFATLPGLKGVVLWGLCDGASAALMYCHERRDARVAGLCLLNPWVRSAQTLARTQVKHYYLQRLTQPGFWRKLLSGGVAWGALSGLLANLRAARGGDGSRAGGGSNAAAAQLPFQQQMAAAWRDPLRPILLLLSGEDYTAKEFVEAIRSDPAWSGAFDRPGLERHTLAGADHTFSDPAAKRAVERLTSDWLHALDNARSGIAREATTA
ncbi:hydrolase 1, exosortase A system-associated [Aquincola sp. S2]|uniref:Hydrolase 1, exosortase A system-associated n=1 Tax=Pseudaquabacterium terrae TaxID=2732868 RepID=A0ABX2EBL6_9BURK|nr:hydrolase 1, exosortase A system-associated [Aquabacterium terrae]NRF66530.1 hydrolase 1, exosortase A system-associated [Aquabacterium terrae]